MSAASGPFTHPTDNVLPGLSIPWPKCGHCGEDVEIEDGAAWCGKCRIAWDSISEDATGRPDPDAEGSAVPCEIVVPHRRETDYEHHGKRWQLGPRQPCILPSGHDSEHLCPYEVTSTPLTEATS